MIPGRAAVGHTAVEQLLRQWGHKVAVKPSMGRTQTIQLRNGLLYGASDPRNPDGQTLGY